MADRDWCCSFNFVVQDSLIPSSVKFSLSSANSAIALADGQQAKTHGLGHVEVHLGTKEFQNDTFDCGRG